MFAARSPLCKVECRPGALFYFGAAHILWRILSYDEKKQMIFVIADREFGKKKYHETREPITWEKCTLRKWLNEEFLRESFTPEEQEAIVAQKVPVGRSRYVEDKVSIPKAGRSWEIYFENGYYEGYWWMRDDYASESKATICGYYVVDREWRDVLVDEMGEVRPVLVLDLRSPLLRPLFQMGGTPKKLVVPDIRIPETVSTRVLETAASGMNRCHMTDRAIETHAIDLVPGACFPFGAVKVPWRVLAQDMEKQTLLVIADQCICKRGYQSLEDLDKGVDNKITWKDCSLRRWLNGEFLSNFFTDEEQQAIVTTSLTTSEGGSTDDKVFLLSTEEAMYYLPDKYLGWLRGSIEDDDYELTIWWEIADSLYDELSVHPAMVLDLQSPFFRTRTVTTSDVMVMPQEGDVIFDKNILLRAGAFFVAGSVRWRILKVDPVKRTVLVIANQNICEKPYHERKEDTTWENCTLRKWLNEEFLQKVFTPEEQADIVPAYLNNSEDLPGEEGGSNTIDKVFILSKEEVKQYFEDEDEFTNDGGSSLLRSTGSANACAGVRPAMFVRMSSSMFSSWIHRDEMEKWIIRWGTTVTKAGERKSSPCFRTGTETAFDVMDWKEMWKANELFPIEVGLSDSE